MKIAVLKETLPGEKRVALVPESVSKLVKAGHVVIIEQSAGALAYFADHLYEAAGANIATDRVAMCAAADLVVKVRLAPQESAEIALLKEGCAFIALLQTLYNPQIAQTLANRHITSFSMDAIPRIARAQNMDVLSSMSSLNGYKAVLIAANSLGKYLPLLMTAAGTVPPSRGLILGAGVAGLQAIATARRLGAVVEVFDVRPAVKEQVESLGATFIEVDYGQPTEDKGGYAKALGADAQERQQAKIHERLRVADFVITTALVPGRKAPILITKEMVADMRPGSVIVDLAAETGGNCELTEPGATVVKHEITIHGPENLPSEMPTQASLLFSRNMANLLMLLLQDGQIKLNFEDAIISECCITHAGEIRHERTKALLQVPTVPASPDL